MKNRLADELVRRSIASPDEASTWLRAREGESFVVWLTRHGLVEDEALAGACAAAYRLPRATKEQLDGARPATFQRIPIEILHDAGLLPLTMAQGHRLVVGVVDPGERAALEEAEFFAGVALELCVMTVREMADAFERLAGRPWRVQAQDLPSRPSHRRGARHSDPVDGLRARLADIGEPSTDPRVEVLPSDAVVDFELTPAQRKEHAPAASDEALVDEEEGETTAGPWSQDPDDSAAGWRDPTVHAPVVSGMPAPSGAHVAATDTSKLRPAPGPEAPPTPRQIRAAERRRATSGGPAIPSGSSAVVPDHGHVGPIVDVAEALGEPVAATEAAIDAAIAGVAEARSRDDVARQLVESLSLAYATSLVLSLRQPHLVVWSSACHSAPSRLVGGRFEVVDGSVWERVSAEGHAYVGPLPGGDPLRRLLGSACPDTVLLLPVLLNRRPISVVVVGGAPGAALPAPGRAVDALSAAVARAFKRVILRTKREPHSV